MSGKLAVFQSKRVDGALFYFHKIRTRFILRTRAAIPCFIKRTFYKTRLELVI